MTAAQSKHLSPEVVYKSVVMFYRNRTLGFNYRVALWLNNKGINYESQSDQPPEEDLHYCSPGKISVLPHAVPNTPHLGSLPEADVDAYGGSVPGRVALSWPLLLRKDKVASMTIIFLWNLVELS